MEDKHCILIDERDQSSTLKSINRILREEHGINFIYEQINPSDSKFQSLDEESETPMIDLEKIKEEILSIPYFRRSDTIAIDYNLVENELNGFQVASLIRKLGYKTNKEILLYSAGIEGAIDSILKNGDLNEKKVKITELVNGNINFIKKDDYQDEIIRHIRKGPSFNFDIELTNWLYKFENNQFKNIFPPYENLPLGKIAREIESNTSQSQEFRKILVEQTFSVLIQINELD